MATKTITGIRRTLDDGRIQADMIFLFPLVDFGGQILDGASAPVVPAWDVSEIPSTIKVAPAWLTAIAAGDAGFIRHAMKQRLGETLASFRAAAWADYNVRVPAEVARRRDEAAESGAYDLQPFTLNV